ncbi:MAG: PAS domain-containing protein, partial [Phycisphaerae bacterium]
MRQHYTEFASPLRGDAQIIELQARLLRDNEFLHKLYDAVSEFVLVLNEYRQIIFCNQSFLDFLGSKDVSEIYGLRPGEAVKCAYACENPGGCGTSKHCAACGAVNAI